MYDYGYDYGYGYDSYDYGSVANAAGGFLLGGVVMWIIVMAVSVFSIICMWKLFTKAGKKGWASLIPIYNIIVMIEIAELPMWYLALFLVPFANIYAMFKIYIEIAHKFGKSTGFGVGMVFLNIVFVPILAFGKAEYKGSNGIVSNNLNNNNINTNMQNNQQPNVPNNNGIPNVMDVNSGINMQSMIDSNIPSNGNAFQPIGNVDNNVQDLGVNNVNTVTAVPVSTMNNMVNPVNVQPATETTVQPVQFNNTNANVDVNQNSVNNMNKTCPNCGTQLDYNTMFCTNCGQNL